MYQIWSCCLNNVCMVVWLRDGVCKLTADPRGNIETISLQYSVYCNNIKCIILMHNIKQHNIKCNITQLPSQFLEKTNYLSVSPIDEHKTVINCLTL